MSQSFTGTGALLWLAFRRDRTQLGIWIVGIGAMFATVAVANIAVFADPDELRSTLQVFAANPVMRIFGISVGDSIGGFIILRFFTIAAIIVALLNITAVVRHTRANEETGQAEMLAAGVVGRNAALAAALLLTLGLNLLIAIAVTVALIASSLPATGSIAAGLALGGIGLAFAATAAVTAQIYESGRGATGTAAVVLGVAYLLSAVGNVLGDVRDNIEIVSAWPTWLSPIGWGQQMRSFGDEQWWVLALFFAYSATAIVTAFSLVGRRDLGRGLIPESRGPAHASPSLSSPLGLAWRLHRPVTIGWAIGIAIFSTVFGSIADAFNDIIDQVEGAGEMFARIGGTAALTDTFFATILGIMGLIITIYTLQVLLRMRSEETEGHLELILATSTSRLRWLAANIVVAAGGTAFLVGIAGTSAGLVSGFVLDDLAGQFTNILGAALVQLPAIYFLGAIAVLAFAALPRRTSAITWSAYAIAFLCGPIVGALMDLPQWMLNLSPFTHIPLIPAEPLEPLPLILLSTAALTLTALAAATFHRRDLALFAESIGDRRREDRFRFWRRQTSSVPDPQEGHILS